jgi:hypothetical protein
MILQWAIHCTYVLKCMFQMIHLFRTYVARVSFGCCKTRPGCCIYMQVFQVFSYVCCKCYILIFAYVCNGYTRVFKFFSGVLQVFQTYVTSVLSRCCKSRSGVTHVTMHVRSRGGASPYAWCGGVGVVRTARAPRGCTKYGLRLGRVRPSARSAAWHPSRCPDASTVDLYLPFFFPGGSSFVRSKVSRWS